MSYPVSGQWVNGSAADAGIRSGDIITGVVGERVHSAEELIVKIAAHRPAHWCRLTPDRGGKELTMKVTLGSSGGT